MLVEKIEFFKTQLDQNYRNVYDSYDSYIEYDNILGRPIYTHTDVKGRSIQLDGLSASIVIKGVFPETDAVATESAEYSNNVFSQVNYCKCTLKSNIIDAYNICYFFVTNITTLNDGKNCNLRIDLKYDSFTNNFNVIKKRTLYNNSIVAGHYDNVEFYNAFLPQAPQSGIYSNNYTYIDKCKRFTKDVYMISQYAILWRYYAVVNDAEVVVSDLPSAKYGLYPLDKQFKVFCMPILAIDRDRTIYYHNTLYINNQKYYDDGEITEYFTDIGGVLDSWVSTHSPFEYTINVRADGDINITMDANEFKIVQVNFNAQTMLKKCISSTRGTVYWKSIPLFNKPLRNYNTHKNEGKINPLTGIAYTIDELIENEAGLNTNFYKYYGLRICDSEFTVDRTIGQSAPVLFEYIYYFKTIAYRYVYLDNNGGVDYETPVNYYTPNLPYPWSEDPLKSWFQNGMLSSLTGSARSITTGTLEVAAGRGTANIPTEQWTKAKGKSLIATGVENIVTGILEPVTTGIDLWNKPQSYSSVYYPMTYQLVFFDAPVRIETEPRYDDLKRAYYFVHNYGSNITRIGDVFDNYRYFFDFVKTDNCSLPFIKNPYQREDLESAFNIGVTKWHASAITDEHAENIDVLRELYKDVPNGQIKEVF